MIWSQVLNSRFRIQRGRSSGFDGVGFDERADDVAPLELELMSDEIALA